MKMVKFIHLAFYEKGACTARCSSGEPVIPRLQIMHILAGGDFISLIYNTLLASLFCTTVSAVAHHALLNPGQDSRCTLPVSPWSHRPSGSLASSSSRHEHELRGLIGSNGHVTKKGAQLPIILWHLAK